jgi:hypothetical protein
MRHARNGTAIEVRGWAGSMAVIMLTACLGGA